MRAVQVFFARRLSRQGEHARAVALSRAEDAEVLARAGMHLSALECRRIPDWVRLMSLVAAEQLEESLDLLRTMRPRAGLRPALGRLAVLAPAEVIPFVPSATFPDIYDYCSRMTEKAGEAASTEMLSPLTIVARAAARDDSSLMAAHFRRFFSEFDLPVPQFPWKDVRLDLSQIVCNGVPSGQEEKRPKVSVILTAHDEEKYLPTAVRSILAQSWRNIELIIVDDGSTDNTFDVARQFAEMDPRVVALRLDSNRGTWAAKNYGLQKGSGDYFMMHDADDWSHPYKVVRQLRLLLDNPRLQCSSSYMLRVNEQDGGLFTRNAASYLRWNPSSLLFRRSVLDEVGDYFPELLGGDCEFAARIESRWGRASHLSLKQPLSMGWFRTRSLSGRFRGGKDGLIRLAAWESWRRRHADAAASGNVINFARQRLESHNPVL